MILKSQPLTTFMNNARFSNKKSFSKGIFNLSMRVIENEATDGARNYHIIEILEWHGILLL